MRIFSKHLNNKGTHNVISVIGIRIKLRIKAKHPTAKEAALYHKRQARLSPLSKCREGVEPILTVVLMTFNHKKSIAKAIESILEQKTDYPYLIKILDDCSSDGTTDICMDFSQKHPEKIELIVSPYNTDGKNISFITRGIKTKYVTMLDGDDYWCHPEKIQRGVSFLEENSDYVTWAHDTLCYDVKTGHRKSYMKRLNPGFNGGKMTYQNCTYVHFSARINRNIIDFEKEYQNVRVGRDIFQFYFYLDKGPLYFCNEVMSVYNQTGGGAFSSLSKSEEFYSYVYRSYMINKYTNFRHYDYFSKIHGNQNLLPKITCIFGKRLGFKILVHTRYAQLVIRESIALIKRLNRIKRKHYFYSKKDLREIQRFSSFVDTK